MYTHNYVLYQQLDNLLGIEALAAHFGRALLETCFHEFDASSDVTRS